MVDPVLVAAPVAILPAALVMWWLLARYEEYFDDSRVFIALTFGFFAGLLAIFLELALFPFLDPQFQAQVGPGTALMMFIAGYALFETGIKTAVMGMRRYRLRKDTPFYGAAFGVGMGAMMALGFIAINLNGAIDVHNRVVEGIQNGTINATLDQAPPETYLIVPFLGMALVPIGAVLAHAAAGALVGRHVVDGQLWKGWILGAAVQAPAILALGLFWPSIGRSNEPQIVPGLFALAYGLGALWLTRRTVLDKVVPADVKDALRRAKRREARKAARDEEE